MAPDVTEARLRAICERWGFPDDLAAPGAGLQALEAVSRVDSELGALYPEQRERLAWLYAQETGTPEGDAMARAFVFGLMMQAQHRAADDAGKAGGDQ
ncbi:MAG TPA: hypothetical protein VEA80_04905 [Vitreimonas sp.]|uniref:hypothetical protein n=1 Tax=Vitreimonas sp. TaxID=3069702 RepID=UPI002D43DC26|nr:hypothetical protein [Vitreimonas sp.]HYD86791.1 hypothetical protein [Vitreimonas sp.]